MYYNNSRPWDIRLILLFQLLGFDKLPAILVLGLARCLLTTKPAFHHNPG